MKLLLVSFLLLASTSFCFQSDVASAIPLGELKKCEDIPNAMTNPSFQMSNHCVCKVGFKGPASFSPDSIDAKCVDADECKDGSAKCHVIAACKNQLGFYQCFCPHGYTGNGIGNNGCADLNECQNTMMCGADSICKNLMGSYECMKCDAGHSNVNGVCKDINECSNATICGANCICKNTIGSYTCTQCYKGYRNVNDKCEDVDECTTGIANCHDTATCINQIGSFYCMCPPGFTGSGDVASGCKDIDECRNSPCVEGSACLNDAGSFQCYCLEGYSYDKATQKCKATNSSQVHTNSSQGHNNSSQGHNNSSQGHDDTMF